MKRRLVPLLFCFCSVFGFAVSAFADDTCTLTTPPRTAAVNADHGAYLFVFPRRLGADYTGCQTMWDEKGTPLMLLRFERGALVSYQEFAKQKSKAALTCRYSASTLKTRNRKCPSYENVEAGFRTMSEANEPNVPAQRDPRRD